MSEKSVAVIGLGTWLYSDQGLGLHVVRRIQESGVPESVECIEGGMSGLGLIPWMDERDRVIFVGTFLAGEKPGSVSRWKLSDLEELFPIDVDDEIPNESQGEEEKISEGDKICANNGRDLVGALQLAQYVGISPEVVVVGVEPESTGPGSELSELMQKKLPTVVKKVKEEIHRA
jgi:hydrogenase maturation protease